MKHFMILTKDEDLRVRARATELVGIVTVSVGRIMMEPILPPFIEAAISVTDSCLSLYSIYLFTELIVNMQLFEGFWVGI